MTPTDADLVERSRRNNAAAFGSLVERHHKLVFGVAFARCRDTSLAEEIAQEAFVRAWRDLDRLRRAERVGSWVAGIARNLAAKAERERARTTELPELAGERTPEDELLDREDRALLYGALAHVPDAYREVLVLYYLEEQSVARIAEGLAIREDLVKQRLARGRNALRDHIAARVESALGRMRPRAGCVAVVVAAIAAIGHAPAASAAGAAGKGILVTSVKKTAVIAFATLAILAVVIVVRASGAPGPRTTDQPASARSTSATAPARPAASTPVHDAPSPTSRAAAPVSPPANDEVARALQGAEPSRKPRPVSVQGHGLYTVDGFTIVHLGAGAPTTKPFGPPTYHRTSEVTGRVVDRRGQPVADAIVLADSRFDINEKHDVMTIGGGVTDGGGAFRLEAPADGSYALALVRDDWSQIASASTQPLELRLVGHGALHARFTYDGGPETFVIHTVMKGAPLRGKWQTDRDGTITIPSLPPGTYEVSAELAQSMFGGASDTRSREVTIVDGETAELSIALAAGTEVVVTARWPAGSTPKGVKYCLFTERAPRDGADARARTTAEHPVCSTYGAGLKQHPAAFHDVAPATYYACAGFFDVAVMDVFDHPFGCTKIEVDASQSTREVEVVLDN